MANRFGMPRYEIIGSLILATIVGFGALLKISSQDSETAQNQPRQQLEVSPAMKPNGSRG